MVRFTEEILNFIFCVELLADVVYNLFIFNLFNVYN